MNNGHQHLRPRERAESGLIPIPTTGSVEFVHGLGRRPRVAVTLECLLADNGYVQGDEIPTGLGYLRNTAAPSQPFLSESSDGGKVTVTRNAGAAQVWMKDASGFGTITAASWAIRIRCA